MHSTDYLEIVKDGTMVGRYCSNRTGQNILLTGDQILITSHSDNSQERRGFRIHFTFAPLGMYFFGFLMFVTLI